MMVGRNDEHFPEIGRQLVARAKIVDDLADLPMLRHRDQVALHQAAGRFLRIGQRFLDRGAVVGLHRAQHGLLLVRLEVFEDRDRVVGVELGREVGHLLRLHLVDHVLADMLVELGIDVGVDNSGERLDQVPALVGRSELDQVGDVGGVEVGDQGARRLVVAVGDRVEHFANEARAKPVFLVVDAIRLASAFRLMRRGGDGVAFAHASSPRPALLGASLCPPAHWRNREGATTWRPPNHQNRG